MKRASLAVASLALLGGCVTQVVPPTSYYVLEYYPALENRALAREEPFSYSVHVLDSRIPRTYSRKQIVVRDAGPRFSYSASDVWGVDLADTIPNLVATRLQRYRMFQSVRRDVTTEAADFEVVTNIEALELVRGGARGQARLEMEFNLAARGSAVSPVQHRVARQETLADASVEAFVIRINDMILEETDLFVVKVIRYLESGETSEAYPTREEGRLEPFAEDTQGFGVVMLPSLSGTDQEPFYRVYGASDEEVATAKMGAPVVIPEGRYRITYGSGRTSQLMEVRGVLVVPRYKRVIEPNWGALTISVVTETRESLKIGYEVYDGQSGESYGTDISANETLGERGRVWVLRPGGYKITINGEPFATYKDFTTVGLVAGDLKRLTIVVGTDEQDNPTNLIGAGVLEEEVEGAQVRPVRFTSTVSATADFSSNNEVDAETYETQTTVSGQTDARLILDQAPFLYTLRTVVNAGVTKSPDTDFRVSSDDVILKNTLIYFFYRNLGLYSRFDADSHFFPEYVYYAGDGEDVTKRDRDGDEVTELGVLQTQVKPSFLPLILREGLGLNYRLVNLSRAELNLRTGLGLRQDFNGDVYVKTTDPGEVYEEQETTYQTGIEVSVLGSVILPFGLTYTLSSEALFPFDQTPVSLDWENILDLRLLKYLSLEYTLALSNRTPEVTGQYFVVDHKLVLRATYVIR